MPKRSKPENEVNFYRMDATDGFVVSGYDSNKGIAIAELSSGERDRMAKEVALRPGRDVVYASGPYAANVAVWLGATTGVLPLWAAATGYATTLGAGMGAQMRSIVSHSWNKRVQRKIAASISASPDRYMHFSNESIPFELPSTVLDEVVDFQAESGRAQRTVESLAKSVKDDLFGIKIKLPSKQNNLVTGAISPGHLVAQSLINFSGDRKGHFLTSSMDSVGRLHASAQALPGYGYQAPAEGLSEGIMRMHERHQTGLLIGALGVYGTLRAQAGLDLSEMIKQLYATHGSTDLTEDSLLTDAYRFSTPTAEDVEWQQITHTRTYIRLMDVDTAG